MRLIADWALQVTPGSRLSRNFNFLTAKLLDGQELEYKLPKDRRRCFTIAQTQKPYPHPGLPNVLLQPLGDRASGDCVSTHIEVRILFVVEMPLAIFQRRNCAEMRQEIQRVDSHRPEPF